MAQLIVRNLEDAVAERLKRRAKRHGRSMEEEVRQILRDASRQDRPGVRTLGARIAARFSDTGLTTDLPELRGEPGRPASFDE